MHVLIEGTEAAGLAATTRVRTKAEDGPVRIWIAANVRAAKT